MKRWVSVRAAFVATASAMSVLLLPGCAGMASQQEGNWIALFDGKGVEQFNPIGKANWRMVGGILEADEGPGFLVTKQSCKDFRIRAEFYAEAKTTSGIFIRAADPSKIAAVSSYKIAPHARSGRSRKPGR